MDWHGIVGHNDVVAHFRRALARGRLASTFLFVGPDGIGKRLFAYKLAQCLLCQERPAELLDSCRTCPSCLQVAAGSHPDVLRVARPKDRATIPLELLIGDDAHRGQQGLCHDISLRPFMGSRRVAIIEDADFLKQPEGPNCLLKTLEEPPPNSVLILIGASAEKQLPTIRSRSQIVRFRPLDADLVADLLMRQGLVESADQARRLAMFGEGSVARAMELADPALWDFRRELLAELGKSRFDGVALARAAGAFVDAAGKEAPLRRARARQAVTFALDFYRWVARMASGLPAPDDADLAAAVERGLRQLPVDGEWAAAAADRCHDALIHIDRFINQANWLEAWLDDLAQLSQGRALPA